MKPAPAPNVPGNTEFERFDNAVSKLLSVPKSAFPREEVKWIAGAEETGQKVSLCFHEIGVEGERTNLCSNLRDVQPALDAYHDAVRSEQGCSL